MVSTINGEHGWRDCSAKMSVHASAQFLVVVPNKSVCASSPALWLRCSGRLPSTRPRFRSLVAVAAILKQIESKVMLVQGGLQLKISGKLYSAQLKFDLLQTFTTLKYLISLDIRKFQ